MASDIMVLNIQEAQGGFVQIRVLFWIQIANPFPNSNATSAYAGIATDPNTSGILAQIQAGTVIEEANSFLFPLSWISTLWSTAVEPLLLAYLNARKAVRAGTLPALPDPGLKYKIVHDSVSGWSA